MKELTNGIYEQIINVAIQNELSTYDSKEVDIETISSDSSADILSRYLQKVLLSGLSQIRDKTKKDTNKDKDRESINAEIKACNEIIEVISNLSNSKDLLEMKIGENGERLLAIWNKMTQNKNSTIRPKSSISVSRLFTGGSGGFQLSDELNKEIMSSDEVDFLVSFIKNSGINTIRTSLDEFTKRGGKLRILTTTYMGTTEPNTIKTLANLPNTEIKISYDAQNTRLHAKSYIFKRNNGFTTAYIGSSNLSRAAVTDGMEWNVKLTNQDTPQVIQEICSTFEVYWNSKDFESFNPETDYDRLLQAVNHERYKDVKTKDLIFFNIELHPFQKELIQELNAQRVIHNNYRNLVVAATGTGKTILSAFDYRDYCHKNKGKINRLLFIAHTREIVEQSLYKFRVVLKDQNFGDLCLDGYIPEQKDHLFMSIQSFNSKRFYELPADFYDFIIVDEVHHGCADSYKELLTYFKPKILLGLTATPERMDKQDITKYFGNKISCEIRLPEAINRELLVPFQYYAIADPVDISRVRFERGKFNEKELSELYVNNDQRLDVIWKAITKYQPNTDDIKCIGFCVSIDHANYMAERFNEHGLKSIALTSKTDKQIREESQNKLSKGELQFIFTVDLYNEGVDIPEINTELMLRPTESKTIFIQQLGRGLRKSDNKSELIVLDFVGQFNKNYHVYEQKLGAMVSLSSVSLSEQIEKGFQGLPLGCYIELEKIAKERILQNIKDNKNDKRGLMRKLNDLYTNTGKVPTLTEFLNHYNIDPCHIYYRYPNYNEFCKESGLINEGTGDYNISSTAFQRLCNINSRRWIMAIKQFLKGSHTDSSTDLTYATMFYYTFYQNGLPKDKSVLDFIDDIKSNKKLCSEIIELLDINYQNIDFIDQPVDLGYENVLDLYCDYTKEQILAALGKSTVHKPHPWREGVLYLKDKSVPTDIFLISLNKEGSDYSPTTMYEDYPISEKLFHWQSQNGTTPNSGEGLRYTKQRELGTNTLLFVRKEKKKQFGISLPYTFLGKANFISSEGKKPMSIVWEMENNIPAKVIGWSPVSK